LKVILVASALPLAFFANVFRISSILLVADLYGRDAALGFFHYASDLILFVTAVALLMLLRRCMKWLISGQRKRWRHYNNQGWYLH
jgi:exosortase/archaeosortase family protein